jgi:hypothetical protein
MDADRGRRRDPAGVIATSPAGMEAARNGPGEFGVETYVDPSRDRAAAERVEADSPESAGGGPYSNRYSPRATITAEPPTNTRST